MKAAIYEAFGGPISVETVQDPAPAPHGVVLEVRATGLCRSDWHGWKGHDPDIRLPHVPGHELAGVVAAVGKDVTRWQVGDRVTLPFVCGCGTCPPCVSGNHQICDHQFQPGFTNWGSFAQFVAIDRADINLVRLPPNIDDVTAASLGCRFATAFRAVVDQGQLRGGQWLAVHGCGGVGASAIMIGRALGAQVVAVDIAADKLRFAETLGAAVAVDGNAVPDVAAAIREITGGGAYVSVDALGSPATCWNSVACLRKAGRHIQVGLLLAEQSRPPLPMDIVIAKELQILGSHGMQAHRYDAMLAMIVHGALDPSLLVGQTVDLATAATLLPQMDRFPGPGVTVINQF